LFDRERENKIISRQSRGRGSSRLPADERAQSWSGFQDPKIMT